MGNEDNLIEIPSARIYETSCFTNGKKVNQYPNSILPTYLVGSNQTAYIKVLCQKEAFIPISTFTQIYFDKYDQQRFLIIGLYYGFAIMVLIINLFYFFSFKDRTFLYYALLLFSICFVMIQRDGLMHLLTSNKWFIREGGLIVHLTIIASASFFTLSYLKFEKRLREFRFLLIGIHLLIISLYILYLTTSNFKWYAFGDVLVVSGLVICWISGLIQFKKNTYSKFFHNCLQYNTLLGY